MGLTLVLGGQRSGKSEHAERLAADSGADVTVIAPMTVSGDAEMEARVAAHRARRPADWTLVETLAITEVLRGANPATCVLLDSLGTWIAERLWRKIVEPPLREEVEAFATDARGRAGEVIVVCEQAGSGVVPPDAQARAWLDHLGELTTLLARAAESVRLVVAGRVIELPPGGGETDSGELELLRHHGDRESAAAELDFAVNIVPGGPPGWLLAAMHDALADVASYPLEDAAVHTLSGRHGGDPEEIVLTPGASQAFWLVADAVRPRHAACVQPAFVEPELALRTRGYRVTPVYLRGEDWQLDPDAVPDSADLVTLGRPNNPTGSMVDLGVVDSLCRPGRVTVVDEAFIEFAGPGASLVGSGLPGLVVVRSITKLCSIPGVRAGYIVAERELAARLRAQRPSWPLDRVALAAIDAVAGHAEELAERAARVADARGALAEELSRVRGVKAWASAANFLLLRAQECDDFAERLARHGIAARSARGFRGLDGSYVRVAVRGRADNRRLVAAVRVALGEAHG
jgi:histidinol-phosphate/aromatic aminotransferase/cobyric acid decarboxylase-like protein/adenosyl cobinamide kinase/adenosyl cobinamide phosphate guanylyltransferase